MTCKNLIPCLIGFLSISITVQVEGYNFRSANRSMASVENQRYIKSDKKHISEDRQDLKPKAYIRSGSIYCMKRDYMVNICK